MGIYIPDMEMPKGHNYVTITIWSSGAASSVLFDREGVLRDFKDFKELKAVPVPEHKEIKAASVPEHGRLVDADALIKRLEQQRAKVLSCLQEAHRREEGYTREDYIFERNGDMISILRNQAAVIPAEKMI